MIKKSTRKPEKTSVEETFGIVLQRLRRDRGLFQKEVEQEKGKSKK